MMAQLNEIVKLLRSDGWFVSTISASEGWWRSSPFSDTYRWEMCGIGPDGERVCLGCWDTMTLFLKVAKKNGYRFDSEEIWANESITV